MLLDLLKRTSTGACIGLIAGLLVAICTRIDGFFLTTLLNRYEFRSYDTRMEGRVKDVPEQSIDNVVVIDIDQLSMAPQEEGGLGRYRDWPYAYHGRLIDVVSSGQPKAILFDIIFDLENTSDFDLISKLYRKKTFIEDSLLNITEQYLASRDPEKFFISTAQSGKVHHSMVFEREDTLMFLYPMEAEPEEFDFEKHIIHIPQNDARRLPRNTRIGNMPTTLLNAGAGVGSPNFPQDLDGLTRRAPTAIYFEGPGHVYPSLAMSAIMDILDIPQDGFRYDFENSVLKLNNKSGEIVRKIPIDDHGMMFVNYQGLFKTFYYLPYVYCKDPDLLPPEYWIDKIAIVGSSAPGLMDLRNTPVQETFAGVEIHANVLYGILNNEFVRVQDQKVNFWSIVILAIILGISVSIPKKPLYSLPGPILATIGWVIFSYNQFFNHLIMWEIVRPLFSFGLTYSGVFLYNFLITEKDKRFLRNTFSTYISPQLIDQMYKEKQEPKLGGELGQHTAFFSDIQSFSSFSEVLKPDKMVSLMNEYLTEMTSILLNRKGTLDKYIGDAIVAFWNAPVSIKNHEYLACMTSLEMMEKLKELREKWKSESDWPVIVHNMRHRIGLSLGELVTGNMGSTMRMNYTMMGDMVNLAARLESSAKQYGIYIHVEESLYKTVKDRFEWRFVDFIRVKGRNTPVKTYELLAEKGKLDEETARVISRFHKAQEYYFDQNWDQAVKGFKSSELLEDMFPGRKTNPSSVYLKRCESLQKNPPRKDWDGVWTLTEK